MRRIAIEPSPFQINEDPVLKMLKFVTFSVLQKRLSKRFYSPGQPTVCIFSSLIVNKGVCLVDTEV